ncbi:hypothetical protein [Alteraurantiacibacter palmitatis]|uniref:Uncharacterized protein n=1 Tax=Alteraurantiacibacter palmitatis TaxID=2054628 RepID=A0ABV7E7K9_9SPHN
MSKQLAVSAAFSVFAMAAFALFATPLTGFGLTGLGGNEKGAPAYASAPLDGASQTASALINR